MIDRRSMLFSAVALMSGCSARSVDGMDSAQAQPLDAGANSAASAAANAGTALVGPGPSWNGSGNSGYGGAQGAPVNPQRQTAKPAAHWWTPSEQRFARNLVIGVDADALGGIAYVDFHVEGSVSRVKAWTIDRDTDANGQPRARGGYWLTLDHGAFLSRHGADNTACIYALVKARDSTMQDRLIGPLVLYPEASAHDFSKTVAPSGGDFTSLRAALDAARSARAKAPLITIAQSGFYNLDDANAADAAGSGKGYCVVTTAPGVTATLGRSSFDADAPASWSWRTGWDGMEFRGAGIVFDCRNFQSLTFVSKAPWFNGCRWTTSAGARDTLYWNKSHFNVGVNVPGYWTDVTIEHLSSPLPGQLMVTGCNVRQTFGDTVSGTHFVVGNYVTEISGEFFRRPIDAMTIQGPAGASVERTGYGNSGALILKVNGQAVETIPIGVTPGSSNFNVSDVVARVNARAGWRATLLDDTRAARYLGAPSNADVSVARTMATSIDIHADWWQGFSGPEGRENVIIRNNVMRAAIGLNASVNNDARSVRDMIVKGNVWVGDMGPIYLGGATMRHYVFANNTHQGALVFINDGHGDVQYSVITLNAISGIYKAKAGDWPAAPTFADNVHMTARTGDPPTALKLGNLSMGSDKTTVFAAAFVDAEGGDFRPAATLLKGPKTQIDEYDGRLNKRAELDVAGAWAGGFGEPIWPF